MGTYRFEEFELDTAAYRLLKEGETVRVEPQVFDVLVYLVANRDRLISKEELLDNVWGNRFVSESALTSRIKSARRAVDDSGREQRLIRNYHGRGYQFVGDVVAADDLDEEQGPPSDPAAPNEGETVRPISAWHRAERLALSVDEEFPFVGRTEILRMASDKTREVIAGTTGTILIGGEPGIGKTRLATEIARSAPAPDVLPLGGRCDRHLTTSLQPWLEALGAYVDTADTAELESDVSGIDSHLRRSFPGLAARLGPAESQTGSGPDDYATIDALVVLIERISERQPLLFVLDDMQWAGGPTRALASLLVRRAIARVLLVLTFRTTIDDLADDVGDWLGELGGHAGTARVDLEGLNTDDVQTLTDNALGEAAENGVGAQVWNMSEGQPLFATELLRDVRGGVGVDHLPDSVATLVRSRVDRLPSGVSRLVGAAAALGQDFDFGIARETADLAPAEALDAVDVALGAELIHEVDGNLDRFRFSHQLVPMAVLDAMTSARRIRLHGRIVEVLEARGGSDTEIAHHLIEASPMFELDSVVGRVRATAAALVVQHQFDGAASLLARLAELPVEQRVEAEILTDLADAYNRAGRQPLALEPLDRAVRSARRRGWTDILVLAALGRWGQSPFRASRDRSVVPLIDEALEHESDIERRTVARLLAKRAAFNLFVADLSDRDQLSSRAERLVGTDPTPERLEVLEARWMSIACPATVYDLADLDAELIRLRKELGALTTDACAPEISLYWQGRGDELHELAAELRDDPRQRRDVDQWRTTALAGMAALFDGRVDEARDHTDRALVLGREPWGEAGQVVHGLVHLLLDVLEGDDSGSVDRWRRIAQMVPSDAMKSTQAWAEARFGDHAAATELVEAVTPSFPRLPENFMGGFGLVGYSEAALLLAREDLFPSMRTVLTPLADRMLGHPWAPSFAAADVLARVAAASGDDSQAEHRSTAHALYTRLGANALLKRL